MRLSKKGWRKTRPAKPNDLIPVMTGKKQWWKSKTLQGLAIVALGIASKKFGWGLGDEQTARLVADTLEIIGLGYAAYGRATAKKGLTK